MILFQGQGDMTRGLYGHRRCRRPRRDYRLASCSQSQVLGLRE